MRWWCGLDEADGRRTLRRVRLLDAVPEVLAATEAASLPVPHLDVLAAAVSDERVELARRDAAELVGGVKSSALPP